MKFDVDYQGRMRMEFTDNNGNRCDFIIPDKIVEKGDEAVRKYAESEQKKHNASNARRKKNLKKWGTNPNFPVEVGYGGVLLKGKIVSALDGLLTVRCEEPCQGEEYTNFHCFGSAMAGHYIFESDGTFSEHAVNAAKRLLISIYKDAQNKPLHDMATRLNGGQL